jgi:hypothetical protein
MASKSPTMAFEPTPALEQNKENYSPFGYPDDIKPRDDDYNKSVRFPDFPTITSPVKRAQSIANPQNIPLLEPISSASNIPRQQASSVRFKNAVPEIDMDAYIENTRSVIEGQREGFEKEKKTFDRERKMWNAERSMLKARIAELEFKLNKSQDTSGKRRYSNDSTTAPNITSFRATYSSFSGPSVSGSASSSRQPSQEKDKIATPIWEGIENTAPVTRVFSNEDQKTVSHLPSISEDEAMTKGDEISPSTEFPAAPIPIEAIDSNLEGIMIKPTALVPSFVARISSGNQSPAHSPSPRPRASDGLALEMNNLLSPLDEKLKRHAGHTPMNFDVNGASTGGNSTERSTPKAEKPPAPAPTARPAIRPRENSDSYFSFADNSKDPVKVGEVDTVDGKRRADVRRGTLAHPNLNPFNPEEAPDELDEDPALEGPLMLDSAAKLKSSNSFLDLVDAKLHNEISQHPEVSAEASQTAAVCSPEKSSGDSARSPEHTGDQYQRKQEEIEAEDGMPKLKMKRSMNFGSAWGGTFPGRHLS